MKTNNYIVEIPKLEVKGHTWGGFAAEHSYVLPLNSIHPKTLAEAKRIAGDFESLTSARIVITTKEVKETVVTKRLK